MQNTFGIRLKELLRIENISQKEFAETVHVSQACVTYWIKGEKQPTAEAIYNVCKIFNVSADYLLGLSDY